jgi:hypothetical protein
MDAIRVAVVNWTDLEEEEVRRGVAALQEQVRYDLAPAWNVDADLTVVPSERDTAWPGFWGLVLLDRRTSDPLQLEHYTKGRTNDGHPLACVFVDDSEAWTHLASHELLEMLVDPDRCGAVYRPSESRPFRLYARRICDPCASPDDGYRRSGRPVSDFVYPAWFGSQVLGDTRRFDQRQRIDAAFEVRPGGTIAYLDVATRPWPDLPGGDGLLVADLGPRKGIWPP